MKRVCVRGEDAPGQLVPLISAHQIGVTADGVRADGAPERLVQVINARQNGAAREIGQRASQWSLGEFELGKSAGTPMLRREWHLRRG